MILDALGNIDHTVLGNQAAAKLLEEVLESFMQSSKFETFACCVLLLNELCLILCTSQMDMLPCTTAFQLSLS